MGKVKPRVIVGDAEIGPLVRFDLAPHNDHAILRAHFGGYVQNVVSIEWTDAGFSIATPKLANDKIKALFDLGKDGQIRVKRK